MPVADAPWWNPDSPQDGKPLVRHAPTLHHYHHPDQRQLERMRSGIGTPVIVPKATSDGASPAFNANEPGVVHVDPDAPDGGAIVDLTHLNRASMRQALSRASYPHQVFYQLGVSPSLVGRGFNQVAYQNDERARHNSLMPNDYVVPKAAQDGSQSGYSMHTPGYGPVVPTVVNGYSPPLPNPAFQVAQETPSMLPPVPQFPGQQPQQPTGPAPAPAGPVQQYAPQPQPQQYAPPPQQYAPPQPQPYYPPPQPPPVDPNFIAMMQQMQATLGGLANGLTAVTQKVAEISSPPPRQNFPPAASVVSRARTRPVEDNPYAKDARTNTFDDSAMQPIPRGQQAREEGVGSGESYEDRRAQRENVQVRQTLDDLREEPRDGIIVGFETLKLPYVQGPKGLKPRRQVFFELPQVGNHSVRYHDVVVGKNSLTLVYDTRFEDGDMYVPPELGETEIRVHVPHLKKTFLVTSIGLTYPLGVFDQIVLPMHGQEALDLNPE